MKHLRCNRRMARWLCSLCFLLPLQAQAQNPHDPLYRALDDFLRIQTQGLPGKVSYRVTPLDSRTQLAPCEAFEPFAPSGNPAWGKTTIGVRCLGPSSWTVYVQAQISVQAKFLVAARTLTAGQVVGANDIIGKNGDLGKLPPTVLTDSEQAIGKTVKFGIASGQPLRSDQLIAPWAVQQGQNVRTLSRGAGFSVTSDGKALSNAVEGQIVQVRTPSGQTVSGIARAGGIVEVAH